MRIQIMATMVSFVVVLSLLAGSSAIIENETRSNNGTQTNSTFQSSEPKCLLQLDQVRDVLASTSPPINGSKMTDNFYNISRALFPSVSLPALYVKVTIQFLHDYQNGTKKIDDKIMKFTWSKACSYVSVKHISLNTMSVFSLGTICPQRRATELVVTVPPFCKDSPYVQDDQMNEANTWKYVVSTLEDTIMNPKISDPRLNTAACVVIGHEGDITDYPPLWFFYWFILIASLLSSFSIWVTLHCSTIESFDDYQKDKETKRASRVIYGAILKMAVLVEVCLTVVILVTVIVLSVSDKVKQKLLVYFYVYLGFHILSLLVGCGLNRKYGVTGSKTYVLGSYCLFPCLFQIVHHLLWVVCGIISELFWAIPIFFIEGLFFLSIVYGIFLYEKEFALTEEKELNRKDDPLTNIKIIIHLILSWLAFSFLLVTIALIAVGNGNATNDPTASGIEGVLTVVFLWLAKKSGLDLCFKKESTKSAGTNAAGTNSAGPNSAGINSAAISPNNGATEMISLLETKNRHVAQ